MDTQEDKKDGPASPPKLIDISTPKYPGKFAIVDAADFEWLSQWTWTVEFDRGRFYARRKAGAYSTRMHRLILNVPASHIVDHQDGNGLNNQRSNLRIANHSQNNTNRRVTKSSSGYRGVRRGRWGKWYAEIRIDKKSVHLGAFVDPLDAARAYNAAATRTYGEFAWLNKI